MALIKSSVLTQASGSVGGLTYSHGKGGMYMRARAVPVNPNTARQQASREGFAKYSQDWLMALTQVQRDGWDTYAGNVAMKNRLGDTIYLSGQNHFIRANSLRSAATDTLSLAVPLTQIMDAPTVFDLPNSGSDFTGQIIAALNEMVLTFTAGNDWGDEDGAATLVYMGRPRSVTRRFYDGPYRLVGVLQGDSSSGPASPFSIDLSDSGFAVATGQLVRVGLVYSNGAAGLQPTGLGTRTFLDITVN